MPRTSVIVPCFNQLQFTKLCLSSVFEHSGRDWELIVVDNGSIDSTPDYLEGLVTSSRVRTTIITNLQDLGFPVAINQGLKVAVGEYIVLLNNDAVVVENWLAHFEGVLNTVGVAGPMSNYAPPPQLVENVPYTDLPQMHRFAAQWRAEHTHSAKWVSKVSGFCLAFRREVYETIGGMDEGFGLGYFEDDDFCARARAAGFEIAIAEDLFIHHFGTRTFGFDGTDVGALQAKNLVKFEERYGPIQGSFINLTPFEAKPRVQPTVSLVMIVKDEEANLPACLDPIFDLFEEIVIVDTGSTDNTRQLAVDYADKVVDFPWINDFSAARNCAIDNATSDYIFWLDADDRLDADQVANLKQLFANLADNTGYVFKCACNVGRPGADGTLVDQVRLFPRRDDVRFQYRVHEQIMLSLNQAQVPIVWTDIEIKHIGYSNPEVLDAKRERNQAILLEELDANPDEPFVLFNLGMLAVEREQWVRAHSYLTMSLARLPAETSIVPKIHSMLAEVYEQIGDSERALAQCLVGLEAHSDCELLFRAATLLHRAGRNEEAELLWRRILDLRPGNEFSSTDRGIRGHLTLRNLAVLAEERGDLAEAQRLWHRVLKLCPGDPDATFKLTSPAEPQVHAAAGAAL